MYFFMKFDINTLQFSFVSIIMPPFCNVTFLKILNALSVLIRKTDTILKKFKANEVNEIFETEILYHFIFFFQIE